MARTNEEIKLELSEPVAVHFHGGNPEPHMTPRSYLALEELHAEALAFIQRLQEKNEAMHAEIERLQAQNAELSGKVRLLQDAVDQWEYVAASPGAVEDMARENTELLKKVEKLQAERDAAVKSLRGRCFECKNNKTSVCLICSKDKTLKYWQWRGVQKEAASC